MEIKYEEIKELMDKINNSDIRDFKLELNDIKLYVSKNTLNYSEKYKEDINGIKDEKVKVLPNIKVTEEVLKEEDIVEKYTEIKAPLVGVYYSSATPGKAPYVEVGSKVKKGDILCIVEAMKIMNEITSEFDGEIVEILKNDEEFVEFGMPLFKIK